MAEDLERQRKRNNIVIIGLDGEIKKEEVEKWIFEKMEVKVEFKDMWKTGNRKNIVIATCRNEEEKKKL